MKMTSKVCVWTNVGPNGEMNSYHTNCRAEEFYTEQDTLYQLEFTYCPFCGNTIKEYTNG